MRPTILQGDCRAVMREMPAESVDAIVTDPPYEIGFMGRAWDRSGVAFDPATWAEALRVLKPGGHLVAFSATRTYHRMACAVEDAGFEIRDMLAWLYGTGFPKSHDVSKGLDRAAGAERTDVVGSKLGRPGMSKDGSNQRSGFDHAFGGEARSVMGSDILAPATDAAREWAGWGTALKPALEPIVLARKPLVGTVAANVLAHGTGALNIDGCRVGSDPRPLIEMDRREMGATVYNGARDGSLSGSKAAGLTMLGRWPANVLHDGSDEVVAAFPNRVGARTQRDLKTTPSAYFGADKHPGVRVGRGDAGSAARFFYSPKASKTDRAGSKHPTVKPQSPMRWLCRLVTPPGGTILDPFAGSGSTLQAARDEGFRAIGIELSPEYVVDIERRLAA